MATIQEMNDAIRLQAIINQREVGYENNMQRRQAEADFIRLGGEERFNQLVSDPEVQAAVAKGSGSGLSISNIMPSRDQALQAARYGALLAAPVLMAPAVGAGGAAAAGGTAGTAGTVGGMSAAEMAAAESGVLGYGTSTAGLAAADPMLASVAAGGYGAAPAIAGAAPAVGGTTLAGLAAPAAGTTAAGTGVLGLTAGQGALAGAGLTGLASLYGARQAQNAAERAGAIQAQAGQQAVAEQQRQFDIGQRNQQPWMTAGGGALQAQQELMGLGPTGPEGQLSALMSSPGYQFGLQEGQRARERSAASRGGLFSGATGRALERYGQDYATGQYGNRLSQLSSMSGQGQAAASGMAAQGQNYASNLGNLYTSMGASQAGSEIAQGQARQAGIAGVAQAGANLFNPPSRQKSLSDLLAGL